MDVSRLSKKAQFMWNMIKELWEMKHTDVHPIPKIPANKKPSVIYLDIVGSIGLPYARDRREGLAELDRAYSEIHNGNFQVVLKHRGSTFTYEVTHVSNPNSAKAIGIGKYIKDNNFGHNTVKLVERLIDSGNIDIEVTPLR